MSRTKIAFIMLSPFLVLFALVFVAMLLQLWLVSPIGLLITLGISAYIVYAMWLLFND